MKNWEIEISEEMYEIISRIFLLLDMHVPERISSNDMKRVLDQMSFIIDTGENNHIEREPKTFNNVKILNDKLKSNNKLQSALVISRLGIIRYQIKV